jgi:hypothetical protein
MTAVRLWFQSLAWWAGLKVDDVLVWWRVGRWHAKRRAYDEWRCRKYGHVRDGSWFNPAICTSCMTRQFDDGPPDYEQLYQDAYRAKARIWHALNNPTPKEPR